MTDDPRDGLWLTYRAFMGKMQTAMAAMAKDEGTGIIARAKAATAKAGLDGFLRGMDAKVATSLQEMSPDDARQLCRTILDGFEGIVHPLRAYTTTDGSDGLGRDDRIGQNDLGASGARLVSRGGGA